MWQRREGGGVVQLNGHPIPCPQVRHEDLGYLVPVVIFLSTLLFLWFQMYLDNKLNVIDEKIPTWEDSSLQRHHPYLQSPLDVFVYMRTKDYHHQTASYRHHDDKQWKLSRFHKWKFCFGCLQLLEHLECLFTDERLYQDLNQEEHCWNLSRSQFIQIIKTTTFRYDRESSAS